MSAGIQQTTYRQELLDANRAVVNRIREVVGPLSDDAMTRRPRDGGWSIAEVLEHLIISADSYLEMLRRTLENTNASAPSPGVTWKPSFMGDLLVRSFRSPRKRRAPRIYRPGPSPRSGVVAEFVKRQEEVASLIARAAGLEWSRVHVRSPSIRLIRMNLGDAFAVPIVHAERHAGQIERIKATFSEERR